MALPDKTTRKEIAESGARAFRYVQQLFRLTQATHDNAEDIKTLKADVAALKQQVHDLQIREEVLLARAEAAATRSAAQTMNDLALRIGRVEGRQARDK